MDQPLSFANIAIVSCGTLSLELNHLRAEGFLDTKHLFFTTPGLHEDIHELERQLLDRIAKAGKKRTRYWSSMAASFVTSMPMHHPHHANHYIGTGRRRGTHRRHPLHGHDRQ